jgi:hypothetical protein
LRSICACVIFLLNTADAAGQSELYDHSHLTTTFLAVFKTDPLNYDDLHYRPKIEVVDEHHVYVLERINTKKRKFSILEFQLQPDTIIQKTISFRYPKSAGVHARADVSDIRFDSKTKNWIILAHDKILFFNDSYKFIRSVNVSGKWASLQILPKSNLLLSYYYPYGAYLSKYNHEIAIMNPNGTILHSCIPDEGNIGLATWEHTEIVTTNGELILRASVSEPIVYLYNQNLNIIDSLVLSIPYLKKAQEKATLSTVFETMKNGALKNHHLAFINDHDAILSYYQSTSCGGEILLRIENNKIIQVSDKLHDLGQYWNAPQIPQSDYKLKIEDIEWFGQNYYGKFYNNKLYHVHSGEPVSPVGLTNQEIKDLKNIPNLSGSVYFYFVISEFNETQINRP